MFGRKLTGSVLCTSCGVLVGVNDDKCYNCGRRNPALWGFAPLLRALGADGGFVPFVFGLCIIMYILTLVGSQSIGGGGFNFIGPDSTSMVIFGASGGIPVFRLGRWWTVLSAGWLHAGILHIAFNLMALRQLAPTTAHLYGSARMVIIYTAGAVAGFTLSSVAAVYFPSVLGLRGGQLTMGASASIAGLLGALLYYGQRSGSSVVRSQATQWIVSMLVYGFVISGIDNYAHLGGLGGGYLASRFLDPLKAERGDHIVIALLCLGASLAAILYSAVSALILLNR